MTKEYIYKKEKREKTTSFFEALFIFVFDN